MTKPTAGRVPREIVFHAYPRLIFAWPIILLGFLLYPLDAYGLVRPDILAWLWGSTLFVVILTLGVHVNRNLSLFWAVLGSATWLLGIYLRDVRGFAPLSGLSQFVADLNPPYPRHAALAFSVALLVPYVLCWAGARIDEKWVLTHYEVERRRKFSQRESLPRGGLTIDAQYNDMFKFIFGFGGGSLRILDREGNVLREIRWVFFLPRVRQRIDEIVEVAPVAAWRRIEARRRGRWCVPLSLPDGRAAGRGIRPEEHHHEEMTNAQLLRRRLGRDGPHRAVPPLPPQADRRPPADAVRGDLPRLPAPVPRDRTRGRGRPGWLKPAVPDNPIRPFAHRDSLCLESMACNWKCAA